MWQIPTLSCQLLFFFSSCDFAVAFCFWLEMRVEKFMVPREKAVSVCEHFTLSEVAKLFVDRSIENIPI